MRIQALIDRLEALGLQPQEAAVYVHLSMLGPSRTSDVASRMGLNRTDAYRTLQGLVDRGLASPSGSRPVRYEAASPEALFQALLEAQQARSARIRMAEEELGDALTTLRGGPAQDSGMGTFKTVQGRGALQEAVDALVREAQGTFRMLMAHPRAAALCSSSGLLERLKGRAAEGLEVRLLLTTDERARAALEPFSSTPGVGVRHFEEAARARMVVADHTAVVLWTALDPSDQLNVEGDEGLWSDARDLVVAQAALFDTAWERAKDLSVLLAVDRLAREGYFLRKDPGPAGPGDAPPAQGGSSPDLSRTGPAGGGSERRPGAGSGAGSQSGLGPTSGQGPGVGRR